jgi:putative ABC transport system substrate-binding protein
MIFIPFVTYAEMVSASDRYIVVYPKIREPYAAIFRDYVSGIKKNLDHVDEFPVNGERYSSLEDVIKDNPPLVLLALGNKSVKVVDDLDLKIPIIAAVTDRRYEKLLSAGILLTPTPELYLENLFDIYKDVKTVATVYDPDKNLDVINASRKFLSNKGVDFSAIESTNIREAAAAYREILNSAEEKSAIWLLSDNNFLDSSILSMILDVAWEKKLIVFASNPVFVKHGALFALYPDNVGVGLSLGEMAKNTSFFQGSGLQSLKDIRLAVNERTRNHLGINLSPSTQEKIELMIPGQE